MGTGKCKKEEKLKSIIIDEKSYSVSVKSNNETGYMETFCYGCSIKPTGLDPIDFAITGIRVTQSPKEETENGTGVKLNNTSSWLPPKLKIDGNLFKKEKNSLGNLTKEEKEKIIPVTLKIKQILPSGVMKIDFSEKLKSLAELMQG